MHRKEGERCASRREDVCPPPSPFLSRERVRGRIYGRRWREIRSANDVRRAWLRVPGVHRAKCIRAAYQTAGGLLPLFSLLVYVYTCILCNNLRRPHTPRGAAALSCKWEKCIRTHACEVMRKCKRRTHAFMLSVIMLTTGICSNDSFKSVRCNVSWGQRVVHLSSEMKCQHARNWLTLNEDISRNIVIVHY